MSVISKIAKMIKMKIACKHIICTFAEALYTDYFKIVGQLMVIVTS